MKRWVPLFSNLPHSLPQVWLRGSLSNGQTFGWKCTVEDSGDEIWVGVLEKQVIRLKQKPFQPNDEIIPPVYYCSMQPENRGELSVLDQVNIERINKFFRTDIDLDAYLETWSSLCPRFAKLSKRFRGIRLLDQEPVECLFSFLCSQNNNITRISSMLQALRDEFGEEIEGEQLKSFPTVENLFSKGNEDIYKKLGKHEHQRELLEVYLTRIEQHNQQLYGRLQVNSQALA